MYLIKIFCTKCQRDRHSLWIGLKNGFSLSAKNDDTIKLGNYKFIKFFEETKRVLFCFADKIELDIAEFIPKDAKLICFDKALDDSTKMN